MKIAKPKPLMELLESHMTTPEQAVSVLQYQSEMGMTDEKGRYLHWDKFRRRYHNPEPLWLATKISRQAAQSVLALGEYTFTYNIPSSLQALLHFIDKNCAGQLAVNSGDGLSRREQGKFLIKSLIMEEAITSAQLEGASTTRKVAKEMLKSERKPRTKDEMMIFNNYRLMQYALKHKNSLLSVEMILKMHEIATLHAIENHAVAGEFRQSDEFFIGDRDGNNLYQPPPSARLNELMQDFCDFINTNHNQTGQDFIHPVVKAVAIHFLMGFIHPFGDGNGRTARALFYWFMLKSGYWLFEYISISRLLKNAPAKYTRAYLYVENDDLDLTYFLYHQAEIIKRAIGELDDYVNDKQRVFKEFSAQIARFQTHTPLNNRQVGILQKAVKETGRMFSVKEVSHDFAVSENTARKDLNGLKDLRLLGVIKDGNSVLYVAQNNLMDKLKSDT
ncbi:Fic family protein [Conchiformibius steedae]|uniref:Fic family protein n=1 Tax=Conchiformibius steedae TaxID=153493 RepID=UPI0026EADC58|nr:Fic family protein [Conchiformibius steedae]